MRKVHLFRSTASLFIFVATSLFVFSPLAVGISSADTSSAGYIWGEPGSVDGPKPTSKLDHKSPTEVSGIPNPVVQVVASNSDYYALDNTGAVWAWGAASSGELGSGSPIKSAYVTTPTQVQFPSGVTIASLPNPMPYGTGMAIDTNGNAWGWGYNNSYQLCVKSEKINTPVTLPFTNVTLASGAGDHALYYSNGILYSCGRNDDGDLGMGTTSTHKSSTAVKVVGLPAESIASLTSSWHNSGALMSDGTYYDWGYNASGQLGDGNQKNSGKPMQVVLANTATQVSAGGSLGDNGQTIALLSDGSVWMWGDNASGQLGNGSTASSLIPTPVSVPSGVAFDFVNSGGAATYAIDTTGNAWAWGLNNKGQLGIGSSNPQPNPLPISLNMTFKEISATAGNIYGL